MKLFSPLAAGVTALTLLLPLSGCGRHGAIRPASSISQKDQTTLDRYEEIRAALAMDDLRAAKSAAHELLAALKPAPDSSTPPPIPSVQEIAETTAIDQARKSFAIFSSNAIQMADGVEGYYVMESPMQKGAAWVQKTPKVDNPYAGRATHDIGMVRK